jgi:lipopolysaccharide export system permease protein
MINLRFFPSRRVAFYMARSFVLRTVSVLAALVIILQTLDLLGESGKILAVPGNGDAELWRYVGMRIPQLVNRFLPFSVLLGTLITLVTLNQNSEVVSMKAAGISAHQIIAPLILASFAIAAFAFFFQERVVTRSTAALNAWQAVEYGEIPRRRGVANNVWVRHEDDLIFARGVSGRGASTRLSGVTVYERGEEGTLSTIVSAQSARPSGEGWRLDKVETFDLVSGESKTLPSAVVGKGVDPDQFTLANVRADEQDFATLTRSIEDLEIAGRPTGPLQAGLWHKISGPLSAVLMPLLAAVAAFGLARSGQVFVRAVMGMALGFAYFVVDNFALAMGNLGAYPPLLAAWAPILLFLLIGETVLIRTEE